MSHRYQLACQETAALGWSGNPFHQIKPFARTRTFVEGPEESTLFGEKETLEPRDAFGVGACADEKKQEDKDSLEVVDCPTQCTVRRDSNGIPGKTWEGPPTRFFGRPKARVDKPFIVAIGL